MPTSKPTPSRAANAAKWTLLALCLFALQGCVYLRLLDVKSQLASFDQYFDSVEGPDGLTLVCKEPTLRDEDLLKLGVLPSARREKDGELVWEVLMRKRYGDNPREKQDYNVYAYLSFKDGLLTSVRVPRRYTACFTSDFITESVKSLGASRVLKLKRRIDADFGGQPSDFDEVTPEAVQATLGAPFEVDQTAEQIALTYRYSKSADNSQSKKYYTVTFTFDRGDGKLLSAHTRSIQLQYG